MSDEYSDVRAYDPTFDTVAGILSPEELDLHAAFIRSSIGYAAWKQGVSPEDFHAAMMAALDRLMAEVYPDE